MKQGCMVMVFWLFFMGLLNGDIIHITNPKPTHDEHAVPRKKIVLIEKIKSTLNDSFVMVFPFTMTVDNEGHLFVFDLKTKKILKFDPQHKFIKYIGTEGYGAGEYLSQGMPLFLDIVNEKYLIVCNPDAKKYIKFDLDGNFIQEVKFPNIKSGIGQFDALGNLYYLDPINNGITRIDKENKKTFTFLSLKQYEKSLLYKVSPQIYPHWVVPDVTNTGFIVGGDGSLVVYLAGPSVLYYFKNDVLVKETNIWPQSELDLYKGKVEEYAANSIVSYMFMRFFVDHDTQKTLYLQPTHFRDILEFDLNGNLVFTYRYSDKSFMFIKKNGLFYGHMNDAVLVYKEVTE